MIKNRCVLSYYSVIFLFVISCGAANGEVYPTDEASTVPIRKSRKNAFTPRQKENRHFVVEYKIPVDSIDSKEAFGSYLAQDAVWVANHQIFVNQEFDFALAMSMPGIGAGIAARKRQDANRKIAERLKTIPATSFQEMFEGSLDRYQDTRKETYDATVTIYGLLFGDKRARLQLVLEIERESDIKEAQPVLLRFIIVSEKKAMTGEGSWMSDNGKELAETIEIGTTELALLFYEYSESAESFLSADTENTASAECPVGGNRRVKGRIVRRKGKRTILKPSREPLTLLSCDSKSAVQ